MDPFTDLAETIADPNISSSMVAKFLWDETSFGGLFGGLLALLYQNR
jgi:hypothetical protein